MASNDEKTKKFLSKVREFLESSVPSMYKTCEGEVIRVMGDIKLDEKYSFNDVLTMLDEICVSEYLDIEKVSQVSLLSQSDIHDNMMRQLMLQLYDIIELEDYKYTCQLAFQYNFCYFKDILYSALASDEIVFAKLIPIISKIPNKVLHATKQEYIEHISDFEYFKLFNLNVYKGLIDYTR